VRALAARPWPREAALWFGGLLFGASLVLGACAKHVAPGSPLAGPGPAVPEHAAPPPPSSTKPVRRGAGELSSAPPGPLTLAPGRRPDQDLDPEHFHERVDGAAPTLVSLGCRRLLYYRLEAPPADLEVLVFANTSGAHEALVRDAGDTLGSGLPGDEAWANEQCVFFRCGNVYVRLIADDTGHGASIRAEAERVADAIARGEIPP
jgi:hypothetical protein